MALFQEEEVTQEQFDNKYKLNQPDIFSNLGYDDIVNQRAEDRQKRIEDERQWVSNIVSPDKVNEWKNQGAMTAIQVFHKKNKNELVPYMGTWKEGTKSFDIKHISDKIQTGQVITPEERKKFEDYILDLAEIQTRGYTFGGGAMNIGLETIPFMAEFATGLLTSGGTASVGATSSRLSTEVLKKGLKQQIAEGVKKTVYNATINPRTYAFTATRLPQQVRARMGDVMLSDAVAISPEGQAILKESEEKPAIAFMKALALTNIETASEISGAMLVRPVLKGAGQLSKVIASPVLKHLPEGFAEKFVKLAEQVTKLPFAKAVDDLGFNGILEEMGEERVGDLLQFAFNLDGQEGYSFEQLLDAMFPSPEQLGQEALSFAVTGLGMNAVDKGLKSIPKVNEKYTKDGFLIDAGIFRVAGYDSYLDSKVKEELEKKGKSEEEIDNAINFSTRDDKVQFLKETNTPFDSKKEYDAKEFEKDLKRMEVEDKAYEKLTQGGVNQDIAFANAKLFGQFFKKYGSGNIKAFNEWFEKFDVQYNVPVNKTNTFFQNNEDKNLIMTHATKSGRLDDILANGTLVAPSMAITKKGQKELSEKKFGDVLFIRNPESINFSKDNIFDRDIYSPRLPEPSYKTKRGNFVSAYDYDSMVRLNERDPKKFEQIYGRTFEEYFDGAKKVLFNGFTPSGSRKLIDYNSKNLIKWVKKEGLVGGENWHYGLSSFLAKLSLKQTSKKELKKSAETSLQDREVAEKEYEKLQKEYSDLLFGDITKYYKFAGDGYQKISDEDFENILFAISRGSERLLSEYIDTEHLPKELYDKLKDFVDRASKLPRSYFESKPLREVSLTEFSYALAEKGVISEKQKKELEGWGIKVIEYENGNIQQAIDNLDAQEGKVYFQSAYTGSPARYEKPSLDFIGSGEGAQAHGWGLYYAQNKDVAEGYRKKLIPYSFDNIGMQIKLSKTGGETLYTKKATNTYIFTEDGIFEQRPDDYLNEALLYIERTNNDINEAIKRVQKQLNKYKEEGDIAKARFYLEVKELLQTYDYEITYYPDDAGQLYKVDVPENDVLLDEDKKFSEQPEKVREALQKIANDYVPRYFLNNLQDAIDGNKTGKVIYNAIRSEIVSLNPDQINGKEAEATSKLLNQYGIKGITYDGKQDGRCYVIFDDNAVDVLKTYYQEAGEGGELDKQLIAGYTFAEVLEKYSQLQEELGDESKSKEEKDRINEKIDVLEEAFDIAQNPNKFSNEEHSSEVMLNAYYIMNNQEIPKDYVDNEIKYTKNWQDYVNQHIEKKERKEAEYYGYFTEGQNKNIITIMENHDSSTALHELGHLFLNGLNELAKVDENAQKQLEAVNKWLGYSGEYTVQQQEKFARSFEAYLYKGKAPNNTLRQVFENFKEWLKSVYEDITSLQNKGADISEEVQELFDNMFGDDQYYQERKQANELLTKVRDIVKKEKFNDIPVRDDKELDENAKRHKEIAYQILSAGTGKSVKYLKTIFETGSKKQSFGKKREAIQELLDKVDDKITVSGGMRAEWREFFTDTGVSYDTDETDGDYKLVEQALDVILNKSYGTENISNELDERAQYYEKAIDEADRQYKILLSNFRKRNRNVVLSAIYEWLENLDEEIRQDYEDRFIYDSGVIERNENVDKFDKAKRQILQKAMELQNPLNINKDENYQELVKEIVRSLDFLQPLDKAKLTANILDVPSTDWLMSSLDNIMDIAKTMEDVNLRRNLEREIHKELQGTKNVKKNGRSVGKYDYKTNKLFEELRALDRLSPEAANERRLEESRLATAEDKGLSFKDKLVNKFLSYKSAGRTFADTELMKELYDAIVKIKLAGKSAKSELDLIEKLDETKDIEELINIVQNKKESNILLKGYVSLVGNLESTLNAIFNKNIKDRYGAEILYAETQAQAWQHEQKQKFEKEVAKIYNLPEWCWDKKILEYLGKEYVYPEIRRKYDAEGELVKTRSIDRTLTHMDIIQAYIWSKNEVLEKRLINQFGEDTLNSMFDELSLEDVKLAELMMNTAQSFYPLVNKAFIRKYGLDLPKVSCYFPSTPERGTEVDLYNDYSSKSLNNSFTKARAQSETQAMDFHNPLATLYNHIEGVSKFVFMSDSLDKANLRFKDLDLKRVIINKYGKDVYDSLQQELINVTYKKEAPVFNGMNKIIDNMVGNWIQANVAVKPIVGLKQLLSANNYALDMPYMKWQAGFLKALAHPKETIDYVMNIPYIKARYQGSYANEFLKQTVENSAFAMSKKLKDLCNMFIKMGDIGAIIFGGKPYIDYLIEEKGMTEEQAIKQFILSTNRSQQSSAVSSLSNFQVAMTRNPMGKLFIAFKNSPQQYIRMCGDAIVSTANGDMTKTQCAKMLFQFGYLQPFLYAMATSGSLLRFLFTGDDDDLMKDASISIFNFGSDALPVIGDIYKFALNRLAYNEYYMPQTTPLLGDIQTEIVKISKEDVTIADYLDAVGYLGLHVGLGYNSKAFTNMGSGVGDIVTGDVGQGAMKVLGYTDRRAKKITGNEDKKKKKKK